MPECEPVPLLAPGKDGTNLGVFACVTVTMFAEKVAIKRVIIRLKKSLLAAIAPLRNMVRHSGDDNARESGHAAVFREGAAWVQEFCALSP
jgi:hypothetical protein